MASIQEISVYIASELGMEQESVEVTFENGILKIVVNGVDEDVFDEDQGFEDGDD